MRAQSKVIGIDGRPKKNFIHLRTVNGAVHIYVQVIVLYLSSDDLEIVELSECRSDRQKD